MCTNQFWARISKKIGGTVPHRSAKLLPNYITMCRRIRGLRSTTGSTTCALIYLMHQFFSMHSQTISRQLLTIQPPRGTRTSQSVTLLGPQNVSSLKVGITNRSFSWAAPFLWNQLPTTLRVSHPNYNPCLSLVSPVSLSHNVYQSGLKTFLFCKCHIYRIVFHLILYNNDFYA